MFKILFSVFENYFRYKVEDPRFYNLLELEPTPNVSQEEIQRQFRKISLYKHPDKGGNEETYQEISEAYNVLAKTETRHVYDVEGIDGIKNYGATLNAAGRFLRYIRYVFHDHQRLLRSITVLGIFCIAFFSTQKICSSLGVQNFKEVNLHNISAFIAEFDPASWKVWLSEKSEPETGLSTNDSIIEIPFEPTIKKDCTNICTHYNKREELIRVILTITFEHRKCPLTPNNHSHEEEQPVKEFWPWWSILYMKHLWNKLGTVKQNAFDRNKSDINQDVSTVKIPITDLNFAQTALYKIHMASIDEETKHMSDDDLERLILKEKLVMQRLFFEEKMRLTRIEIDLFDEHLQKTRL